MIEDIDTIRKETEELLKELQKNIEKLKHHEKLRIVNSNNLK